MRVRLNTWFIFKLLHGLNGAIIVIEVDGSHHLAALNVTDAQADAAYHVAIHQLYDLRRRRELGVDLRTVAPISSYVVGLSF
jgi:hypothetical protein